MLPKVIGDSIEVIRVLHVDDDPNQFEFIKFFLNQVDQVLKVHCVGTPEEVIYELENNAYDCLVTDFQMPQMNGIDLAKMVRGKYSIPIILYTGQGSEEVAEAAFIVGIDDYLRKEMDPSHYQVLAKRIRHVVEKKQAEILYQTVVEQTRDALSIFIDEKIVFANKSALKLFGVKSLDEIIDINPFKKIPNFEKYLETGFHEFTHIKKNDEPLFIEASSSPINYNGKNAIICFIRDVTEKRVLEQEKKISQERFRSLVEISADGIATFNTAGYVTFINDAFSELTGYKNEELLGKHITNLQTLRKRDLLKYVRGLAAIFQEKSTQNMDFTYYKKDGTPRIGYGYMSLIDLNGKKELILIAKDVTKEKKLEIQYKILSENSCLGVLEVDTKGIIKSINKRMTKYLNLDNNQIIENNILEMPCFKVEDKKELEKIISKIKKDRKIQSRNIELILENKDSIWVNIAVSPIMYDNEFYGINLRISEINQGENNNYSELPLNNMRDDVITYEELITSKQNPSIINTQIRTPLQIIQDSIIILKSNKIYDEQLLNIIEDQASFGIDKLDLLNKQTEEKLKRDYLEIDDYAEIDLKSQ